jgi:hypothetical protein
LSGPLAGDVGCGRRRHRQDEKKDQVYKSEKSHGASKFRNLCVPV